MKKKILALCLLTALCIPVFCVEIFYDGTDVVRVEYSMKVAPSWLGQRADALIHDVFIEYGKSSHPINKLSNTDIRLINKALQRFDVAKDELYSNDNFWLTQANILCCDNRCTRKAVLVGVGW